ncbi:MAG: ScyD/ScyE family protein [Verrucomicrobiota bacterium]|nr:ScyD/ScyE family protein [Verrucomicrobiota bacterium]
MKTQLFSLKTLVLATTVALATSASLVAQTPATAEIDRQSAVTQVVGGLHSPRGLAVDRRGTLYVAEAGDDSAGGAIIAVSGASGNHPRVRTLVSGLPTFGAAGEFLGMEAIAPLVDGERFGLLAITGPAPQEAMQPFFGSLLYVNPNGTTQPLVNVGSFNFEWTAAHHDLVPDQFPDSNPYGMVISRGHLYVVDAGANTLDEVLPNGTIRVLAFFPNTPISDATPTCVCEGPDGALYVGTLALVDSVLVGPSAKVFRVNPAQANLAEPWKTPLTVWASGLFPIDGCAFGRDRNFYASQLFTNPAHDFGAVFGDPHGDVMKIPFNHPSTHTLLTGGALSLAGGVAVDDDGAVFVSSGTAFVAPGTGTVVRIRTH